MTQTVASADRVASPARPDFARIRDRFAADISRYTLGIVQGRPDGFWLFGIAPLILLGSPAVSADEVWWPIEGGWLARRPGGRVGFRWQDGWLTGYVTDYAPRLPRWLYSVTQRVVHHVLTRWYLHRVRGQGPRQPAAR